MKKYRQSTVIGRDRKLARGLKLALKMFGNNFRGEREPKLI